MSSRLEDFFTRRWYGRPGVLWLLLPLEMLFRLVVAARRRRRQLSAQPLPVIVVGNITVGGTGKSPVVLELCRRLQQRGWRPAIVSRGYGRQRGDDVSPVGPDDTADRVGDEPLMLARAAGVPVVVGRDRAAAVRWVAAHTDANLVISDDGLQHYGMARLVELVVIDASRGLGNRHCLPVGPLREPVSRLTSVDQVLVNGSKRFQTDIEGEAFQLQPVAWVDLVTGGQYALDTLNGPVRAVTGIGNPARFEETLRDLGLEPKLTAFPDHHRFQRDDLPDPGQEVVVMTTKDAVKCSPLIKGSAPGCYYALQVQAQFSESAFDGLYQQLGAAPGHGTGEPES